MRQLSLSNLEGIVTLSLAYICGNSRASPDSGNHIGTQSRDPLAPSMLGHRMYRSATSSKVQQPHAVVHFKKPKDNKRFSILDHLSDGSLVQTCTRNLT